MIFTTHSLYSSQGLKVDVNGLWLAEFSTPTGQGTGVIVLLDGRALGGDASYYYDGHYSLNGAQISGTLAVTHFSGPLSCRWASGAERAPAASQSPIAWVSQFINKRSFSTRHSQMSVDQISVANASTASDRYLREADGRSRMPTKFAVRCA
jgi:hypothetical protein